MKVTDKICKTMNKINEDVICYGKDFAFVLDGQSMTEEGISTTKWYVNLLKKEIKKNIHDKKLLDVLNKSLKNACAIFKRNFPNTEVPSVTTSIIRENKDKLEILIVGNPKCLVQTKKIELIEDPRMDRVEENLLKKMKNLKEQKNVNMLEAKRQFQAILNENRKRLNTMYPVIKDKILEENDVVYKEYPYSDVVSAVICTDGFYAYKSYLKIKDKDLYEIINNQGLLYCYNHIRRMESKDPSLNSFPRLKLYDDASAVYVLFY